MLGTYPSSRIIQKLQELKTNPGINLEHVEAWTGINNGTISRIARGKTSRLRHRTAIKIASYIEHITNGETKADELLVVGSHSVGTLTGTKSFAGEDLTGVNFSGQNLKGVDFTGCVLSNVKFWGANLKNAIFDGVTGGHLEFQGAVTDGVVIKNTEIHRWDLRGTRGEKEGSSGWDGAIIENSKMLGFCHGVDWRNTELKGVKWSTGSGHSYGLRLNLTDPEKQIKNGFDNPEVVSFLIESHADGDQDLLHIAWKIRSRAISRCWVGFIQDLEEHYPTALGKLMIIFKDYPGWYLCERVELAFAMIACKTLDDWMGLRTREDYYLFKWPIENEIRKAKEQELFQ